jgi:hypothetical protein
MVGRVIQPDARAERRNDGTRRRRRSVMVIYHVSAAGVSTETIAGSSSD